MKKRLATVAVAAALTASVLTFGASAEEMCKSYLTGEQVPVSIGRERPVALMIENDSEAIQWQRGIGSASIMYEAMVEGGITRIEAIFEDYKDVPQIMPIRSCRPYYVYYAREFDAYYGHYGQVIYAVPILNLPETYDIAGIPSGEDGQDYRLTDGSGAYVRDHEGVTGIYTNYDLLHNMITGKDWRTKYEKSYKGHYKFAKKDKIVTLKDGQEAKVVLPGFDYDHPRFDYNESDHLYYRSEFGYPQIDHNTGEQLAFTNIIIQECPSVMLDDKYLWTDPVNGEDGGEGWYITNGRAERITWKKDWDGSEELQTNITSIYASFDVRKSDFGVTHYYDANGKEIVLNRGKTFVEIVRNQDAKKVIISADPGIDTYATDAISSDPTPTTTKYVYIPGTYAGYSDSSESSNESSGESYEEYYDESYDEYYEESYDEYYEEYYDGDYYEDYSDYEEYVEE